MATQVLGTGPLWIQINNPAYDVLVFSDSFVLIVNLILVVKQVAITGYQHLTVPKFRAIINCQIMLCDYSDVTAYKNLIQFINQSNDYTFTITPTVDDTMFQNVAWLCLLQTEDITFLNIAAQPVGQIIELSFIAINTEDTIQQPF